MSNLLPPRVTEPEQPHPPRYWWLTRLAAVSVLAVCTVIGVRVWWGSVADARVTAAIDGAHARGEKILVTDYAKTGRLSDERNAAFYLNRAEASLQFSATEEWALDNATALPLRDDVYRISDAALARNSPALADIRRARDVAQADWGVNVFSPMWSVLLPHLNKARRIANISRSAAIHAAHGGDHAAAIEHARDICATGRTLDDGNVFLITHLVQIGIEAMAGDLAGKLAMDLQIAGVADPTTRPARTPATRQQVRALIDTLLDDAPRRASLHQSLQGERAAQVDIGMTVSKGARIVRPAVQLDVVGLAKEGEQMMDAAAAPNLPLANTLVPTPTAVTGPRMTAHVVSESIRPALGRAVTTSLRVTAQARLAAVALAIRMYQLDHGGQRPATLDALVPTYLSALPTDPYAAGGQTLRYVADATAPYVYSVGTNGRDDSATVPPWRPDATTVDAFNAPDLFLRLNRANAPPPEKIEEPPEPLSDAEAN